jgi:hypothetical protein
MKNYLGYLYEIYFSPKQFFSDSERLKKSLVAGVLLFILLPILAHHTFVSSIEPDVFIEKQLSKVSSITDGEKEIARDYLQKNKQNIATLEGITQGNNASFYLLFLSGMFYFFLNKNLGFKQWVCASVWCQAPLLLHAIGLLILLFLFGFTEISVDLNNYDSISSLFSTIGLETNGTLFDELGFFDLWSFALLAYGSSELARPLKISKLKILGLVFFGIILLKSATLTLL